MSNIGEITGQQSQQANVLATGYDTLYAGEQIYLKRYTRSVSVLDGYVYYILDTIADPLIVDGSLHFSTQVDQRIDETIAVNSVLLTTKNELQDLNTIAPNSVYIGATAKGEIKFAFSSAGKFYNQSNLWHYRGDAIYPAMFSQVINSITDLPAGPIVSNSLPIWLVQDSIAPVYPSFLIPANAKPPYVSAHIVPEETEVLGQFPTYTWPGVADTGIAPLHHLPSSQLMRDRVELTLYGFTNQMAIQFLARLEEYSLNTDYFGFCSSPSIRDQKRTQAEISVIAMKKTITFLGSYYSGTADVIARRLIMQANISFAYVQ